MPNISAPDLSVNPTTRRQLRRAGFIAATLCIAVVIYGLAARAYSSKELAKWTSERALTTVAVISPSTTGGQRQLVLPGRFEAFATAPLYARTSGYLKSWKQDIGTNVKAGQLLGEIEAPDLEQQLLQAKADADSAKANLQLAEVTFSRTKSLLDAKLIAKQDYDTRASDVDVKRAQLQSAQANRERLEVTKGFTRIIAPFDGVVIERNTDVGALISAGGSNTPLFTVADISKLRLYVNLPQSYTASVHLGDSADITLPEHAGKTYQAKVIATSGAVDSATGTMRLQLQLDNKNHELMPGSYGQVNFKVDGAANALSIPASTLIFNAAGLRVATLGADSKAKLKPISIVRDLGKTLEVEGLAATDKVIDNPPDDINDGDILQAKTAELPAK